MYRAKLTSNFHTFQCTLVFHDVMRCHPCAAQHDARPSVVNHIVVLVKRVSIFGSHWATSKILCHKGSRLKNNHVHHTQHWCTRLWKKSLKGEATAEKCIHQTVTGEKIKITKDTSKNSVANSIRTYMYRIYSYPLWTLVSLQIINFKAEFAYRVEFIHWKINSSTKIDNQKQLNCAEIMIISIYLH